ncbi:Flagellar biosynthesis protein FlhA [Pseudoalteromonas holothuriae]|uniref:Flagellar biosynthesis protein FlhA n=1 Tax=Pseudoalteromonas holothuriae TaxID=2963714 RepID=A0A9W4VTD2_9GAMM|nr:MULTISPECIES: flagellar biosynthesis protein FlhA [unclassified Pseudoalteromonas]CAH9050997.1 Flagellar biosynthesis protein FlhA [Pseudoalteromonas sp. CIP111951]CAH9061657.1 Flagellar biosynthesis protein FlhA [Pseudoalteromonas sp. CIP111854]
MKKIASILAANKDLLLVIAVIVILMMLFIPVPPLLLDILLILNFSLALLILMLTFYTDKPLSFSTFPSLLLIATLFRLGLNISATRLILNEGDAGQVISSIGSFVVGGNYIIGLVVFFILIVVQYVVVTNGAQRVAEVAARFTLDSMPGKQMSIDADLNMGLIDEHTAKSRRENIEKEANFYGAMDGASKFVKGDAIAGIIIILIDIIGGLTIGVAQLGMSWEEALQTYTLLTVGDGIVTQIPSLIIATATGIIITRAATDAHLSDELGRQITSSPKTLFIVSCALFSAMLLPGLPVIPLLSIGIIFLALGIVAYRRSKTIDDKQSGDNDKNTEQSKEEDSIESMLTIRPLELGVSAEIADAIHEQGDVLFDRFETFRKQLTRDLGIIAPKLFLLDDPSLKEGCYELRILGSRVGRGSLYFDKYLAIDPKGKLDAVEGTKAKEPTYGLPACWVSQEQSNNARRAGYTVVDAETTLLTHLTEMIKSHAWELLTRAETEKLISRLEGTQASLLNELIPNVLSYSEIQNVLQQLLKEKVSVRNLEMILECLVDKGKVSKEVHFLCEQVREKLKAQIVQTLLDNDDMLHVITFEPIVEQQLISGVQSESGHSSLAIDPQLTDLIIQQLAGFTEQAISKRLPAVLVCHSPIRLATRRLLERVIPQLHVLAISEIPSAVSVTNLGVVRSRKSMEAA